MPGGDCKSRVHGGQYLGEISALCLLQIPHHHPLHFLLAGTGSQILMYDVETGKVLNSFRVFEGIRVHGISSSFLNLTNSSLASMGPFKIAVYGERRIKLFDLHFNKSLDSKNQRIAHAELDLIHLLPRFNHWVMDVCFLKEGSPSYDHNVNSHLAIGLSDNSVCLWDIFRSIPVLRVKCPERCLLYSMRFWGEDITSLRVASGTIYNEIIIWKLVSQRHVLHSTSLVEDSNNCIGNLAKDSQFYEEQYRAITLNRLSGHEGSIFRIAWSSDGSKLISVSDDRSARIWTVSVREEQSGDLWGVPSIDVSVGPILFGHNARVWDCYISDSIIVTAGEDCTCRVWGTYGNQLMMIREHSGRGIWRCLYDPVSSLLITAGFDSAIKIHPLHAASFSKTIEQNGAVKEFSDRKEVFSICTPIISSKYLGLVDSKSEYVRCLCFAREDTLYVATNNGYLYHVKLSAAGYVKWVELIQVNKAEPIICMDLLSVNVPDLPEDVEDWIAVGDGKGHAIVVRIIFSGCTPHVALSFTWSAERERQLLGIYWCKVLRSGHVFTADPRGRLKLWRTGDALDCPPDELIVNRKASLVAEFASSCGTRITCLAASVEEEVLVCGDQRGNLLLFTLSERLLLATFVESKEMITPLTYFKGAHGISSVASISVTSLNCNQVEICSTGGDGCICYFAYGKQFGGDSRSLEFMGMKKVKELSLTEAVYRNGGFDGDSGHGRYAIGFASADFIIWDFINEFKILRIPCGGWRRPHSYFLGDVPEIQNCFGFVKDHTIHIHRLWVTASEKRSFPQALHMQFHGREIHSLCFVVVGKKLMPNLNSDVFTGLSWIATGSEDGTVRLTRYSPCDIGCWSESKLLGEHVGGSAVRSICFVSKTYTSKEVHTNMTYDSHRLRSCSGNTDGQFFLISVGAKRVLTCWLLRIRRDNMEEAIVDEALTETESSKGNLSLSFQWLSTDMPPKFASTRKIVESLEEGISVSTNEKALPSGPYCAENRETESEATFGDNSENDWRYLAVTAFLVKGAACRSMACFVVVACSNATLTLRALLLPCRLWFDVALLVPQTSPVLALDHVVIPIYIPSDKAQIGNIYLVISGSTDGSITFWDLTETTESFMKWVSKLCPEKLIDCQRRPRTGRGSQGGRWWRSLTSQSSKTGARDADTTNSGADVKGWNNGQTVEGDLPTKICELRPLHVLQFVHQSGVNCLHISEMKENRSCNHENSKSVHYVVSGGDDQALHILGFDLVPQVTEDGMVSLSSGLSENKTHRMCCQNMEYGLRLLYEDRISSAHSSAVKGVWTDGSWVFSTGLDQRVRCWHIGEHGKLIEDAHLVINVPEPEALDARDCGRNRYQIAIAGRGMQMVEFSSHHCEEYTD